MGKFHNVLYIGLKVAWDWGVTDSLTIQELLGNLFYINIVCLDFLNVLILLYHNEFRGNLSMRTDIRTNILGGDFWFKCSTLHCRMEKRFFGSGVIQFIQLHKCFPISCIGLIIGNHYK